MTSPYQVPGQISASGHVAFATVQFAVPGTAIPNSEALALESLRGDTGGRSPGPAGQSGQAPQQAVVTTMQAAGRSVLTAGTTVVIGMLGLLVLKQTLL